MIELDHVLQYAIGAEAVLRPRHHIRIARPECSSPYSCQSM